MKKLLALLALMPFTVFAEGIDGANTSWILTSTALVLL